MSAMCRQDERVYQMKRLRELGMGIPMHLK